MRRWVVLVSVLGVSMALVAALLWLSRGRGGPQPTELALGGGVEAEGFARAERMRALTFPVDHGPHSQFQTEWWYFTGNLEGVAGEHFGYQLTFFRRALTPDPQVRESDLATNQIYFAHFALTDVSHAKHVEHERFSRGAARLAGAKSDPLAVWLEDWRLDALDERGRVFRLRAAQEGLRIDLRLESDKPPTLHGDQGLSAKGSETGDASYYVSYTRMDTRGTVDTGSGEVDVQGWSWFDHEWSTSSLGADAVGWDWFGLQLEDGRELMLFQIRRRDGSVDPHSAGTLVAANGRTDRLGIGDFEVQVLDRWTSPETGASYPGAWRVEVPRQGLVLEIEPWMQDQEMNTSVVYWEGAVRIRGSAWDEEVSGLGYVELTGYFRPMEGGF